MDSGIIGVLGTVLGVLIGGPITYYYAKILIQETHNGALDIAQRQEFNRAASRFRNTFLGTILYLRDDIRIKGTGTSSRINEFLSTLNFKHISALTRFEPFLNANERERLHCAWDEYCYPKSASEDENEKRDFRFNDYKIIEEAEGAEKAKEVALQKIYKLLEFANFR